MRRRIRLTLLSLAGILLVCSNTACLDDIIDDVGSSIACQFNLTQSCCEDHDPRCVLTHDDEDHEDYCACPDGRWRP